MKRLLKDLIYNHKQVSLLLIMLLLLFVTYNLIFCLIIFCSLIIQLILDWENLLDRSDLPGGLSDLNDIYEDTMDDLPML